MSRTAAERVRRGKDERAAVPRSAHADWAPSADRRDPVDLLEEQGAARVPELVPIRYGRMLASPFAFFRGAAAIFAADVATTPHTGIQAQLCGDAHIANFGIFLAPDRSLVFDLNDFDETLPGPWEWDVKRMAASVEIAGRHVSLRRSERRTAVTWGVESYRQAMRTFATMDTLDVWYAHLEVGDIVDHFADTIDKANLAQIRKRIAKAEGKTSLRALEKLTGRVDGQLRFLSAPPLLMTLDDLGTQEDAAAVRAHMGDLVQAYAQSLPDDRRHLFHQYRLVDLARKVVGVGSVGTRAWVLLFEGRDERDPLILQAKEAVRSVLEPYAGQSAYEQQGHRVVEGQRLMQAASDILLGWQQVTGPDGVTRDFYLRQLWDGKGSADLETMDAGKLQVYARMCGWTLARAHARSGDRAAIASYLGGGAVFDEAIATFADAYADQNEHDYAELSAAADSGRIAVERGV